MEKVIKRPDAESIQQIKIEELRKVFAARVNSQKKAMSQKGKVLKIAFFKFERDLENGFIKRIGKRYFLRSDLTQHILKQTEAKRTKKIMLDHHDKKHVFIAFFYQ